MRIALRGMVGCAWVSGSGGSSGTRPGVVCAGAAEKMLMASKLRSPNPAQLATKLKFRNSWPFIGLLRCHLELAATEISKIVVGSLQMCFNMLLVAPRNEVTDEQYVALNLFWFGPVGLFFAWAKITLLPWSVEGVGTANRGGVEAALWHFVILIACARNLEPPSETRRVTELSLSKARVASGTRSLLRCCDLTTAVRNHLAPRRCGRHPLAPVRGLPGPPG